MMTTTVLQLQCGKHTTDTIIKMVTMHQLIQQVVQTQLRLHITEQTLLQMLIQFNHNTVMVLTMIVSNRSLTVL